ncbi:DUF6177 family protein [Nocardiopsis halophila]|uniref:DUF6177 family protein n=1 Tax=Nocardiopsis halophila TaxID=141692 RepID=UPI00034CA03C|nr:DUF6177 family protein [Nocardiopsis halophila]
MTDLMTELVANFENDAPEHHPAVDRRAEKAVLIEMERPLVPLTSWIADAVAVFGMQGHAVQVMTPSSARLTHPLWALLSGPGARWVVTDPDRGHFDGVNGLPLEWDGTHGFIPKQHSNGTTTVSGFLDAPSSSSTHVLLELTVQHAVSEDLVLGGAAETVANTLAGTNPAGWSTNEPAAASWDRSALTKLCKKRAPRPSRLFVAGPHNARRPFVGSLNVRRTREAVIETLSLAIALQPHEDVPHDELMHTVELLTAERLIRTLVVKTVPGRTDLTYEPRWHGIPIPFGMAIGHAPVQEVGLEHALSAPVPGFRLGPEDRPTVWYPLNVTEAEGRSNSLQDLLQHLAPTS